MAGRTKKAGDGLTGLLADTRAAVTRLLRENRLLKAENKRLASEVKRLGAGWDSIRKVARDGPRRRRR